ncbi:MAG: DUF4129 domain-containing protein, partial [Acidimicrobiales bacterium]
KAAAVPAAPATALTGLFEVARFGGGTVSPEQRREALDLLASVSATGTASSDGRQQAEAWEAWEAWSR